MLFGERSVFAIEAEPEGKVGSMYFGRLLFWFHGEPVGDFQDTSDLAGSARWGRRFLSATFKRTRADLDSVAPTELYHTLYGRFFERGGSAPSEPFDRDPFVLDEVGESSLRDRASLLVVRRGDEHDRLILRDHKTGKVQEAILAPEVCDRIIDAYCSWVEKRFGDD